jgi:hypothetical protein
MSSNQSRLLVVVVALVAGVLVNIPSWQYWSGENYDLWAVYVRWWMLAPVVGLAFRNNGPLAALSYVLPSSALRLARFGLGSTQASNLGPFVIGLEVFAGLFAASIALTVAYMSLKFIDARKSKTDRR